MNTSCVAVFDTMAAARLRTVTAETSVSPVPVIVTFAPAAATRYTAVASTRIAGATASGAPDVTVSPALPCTCNAPLIAASGTVTVMRVVPERVATGAEAPPENTTAVARSRLVPFSVSDCPVTIDVGANDVSVIGAMTVSCCDCG